MELNEKEISEVAKRVLSRVRDEIKDQIADSFYLEYSNYLYEHYENYKDKIQTELISEIQEDFVRNLNARKYYDFRSKLYEENKAEIIKVITKDIIDEGISSSFDRYRERKFNYDWKWREGIVRVILENWDRIQENEKIKAAFVNELDKKQSKIEELEKKILELQEALRNESKFDLF